MPDDAPADVARVLLDRYARGEKHFLKAKLARADLRGSQLRGVDLSSADLFGADLSSADLRGSSFCATELVQANLSGANLEGVNFTNADLREADLREAHLRGAYLIAADLSRAILLDADLRGANLRDTKLVSASFVGAQLRGATLHGATLDGASFLGASTDEFTTLGGNVLTGLNLGAFCRGRVRHVQPSHVDFRSVILSVREPLLKEFLLKSGMPDVFAEYMVDCGRSLSPELVFSLLQSTFISYGGPDEAFARKLNDALEQRGVTTFFFKDDAPPGEKLHRVMRKGVNEHDRTILICSESSLQRAGLLNELEETLAREARDGGHTYLIPVRLDDYVINGWKPKDPDVAQAVRDRVIVDFRDHTNPARFDAELSRLIAVLKKPEKAP